MSYLGFRKKDQIRKFCRFNSFFFNRNSTKIFEEVKPERKWEEAPTTSGCCLKKAAQLFAALIPISLALSLSLSLTHSHYLTSTHPLPR